MTETKTLGGHHKDRNRIDVNDTIDVEYIHHQFPWLSHNDIKEVIEKHGPDRSAVLTVLERSASHRQSDDE